jgi:hypothetical protein
VIHRVSRLSKVFGYDRRLRRDPVGMVTSQDAETTSTRAMHSVIRRFGGAGVHRMHEHRPTWWNNDARSLAGRSQHSHTHTTSRNVSPTATAKIGPFSSA